ncbi:hypothetical protein CC1G_07082 [Coprinopsis cinerea okayama7|uniref:Uncharacterized protein n=1 Tax=Coprinopsis cinerea (strain Okayama-7 / 130 / ATCC MYA-4618 / FGSC 9003) TaxID=240176 RepID=A8NUE2_COPC7|nr:hypothetical protein CC1G_07082 [Coprinopsis cinerea okayama7\|eukprot:XP_001836435.1 hypothetical protein CC1G_07082 [Coprinopsis cinerea okayama7\
MAIVKAPKNIRISVPRHDAQSLGPKLEAEIKKQAKEKKIRIDTNQPAPDLVQAIESASEWNSLLITARAERGPQWDIGTQQFLVEEGSDLYYDATPLFESVRKALEAERGPQTKPQSQPVLPPQQHPPPPPHPAHGPYHGGHPRNQTPMREGYPPQMGGHGHGMDHPQHGRHPGQPGGNFGNGYPGSPAMNMRGVPGGGPPLGPGGFPAGGPAMAMGAGGPGGMGGGGPGSGQFNPMVQHQQQPFYGGGNPTPVPMRMGTIGGMSMEDQGLGRHPGMGGMGMGAGGMPMGVGGSPAMARRMTRTMTDEFAMN